VKSTTTDADGESALRDLAPGSYELGPARADADVVTVESGAEVTLDATPATT
jgi:hypothetical protein